MPWRKLWLAWLILCIASCAPTSARADTARVLDVAHIEGGRTITPVTYFLRDPAGRRTFEELRRAGEQAGFQAVDQHSFGFTTEAIWLRFDVDNRSDRMRPWMLELAYAHLDHVALFAVHADGHVERTIGGDALPFSVRPVDSPTLVFPQETPARARVRYYLRAQTSGAVHLPLIAWDPADFVGEQLAINLWLALFYGAILAMTVYNLGVALLLRSREHLYQAGILLSLGGGIFTLSGQTFQFLLPNYPKAANRAFSFDLSFGILFVQVYTRHLLRRLSPPPPILGIYRYSLPVALAVLCASAVLPPGLGYVVVFGWLGVYCAIGMYKLHGLPPLHTAALRYSVLSFYFLAIPIPVAVLARADLIPQNALTMWLGHIGCAVYSVLASLALPARLNLLGERLAALNAQLSDKVDELRRVLRVKDEFIATMSHELRTPLNAIINVPRGLLADFPSVASAVCRSCGEEYTLEPDDTIDARSTCESCRGVGTLEQTSRVRYTGTPAHTARFLEKIERQGTNLLQMVNGVLDYSKMESGRVELSLSPLDLGALLGEVVDEMTNLAQARDMTIALSLPSDARLGFGDSVRLRQVLVNLLANAIKFGPAGQTVSVKLVHEADVDVISVTDQGIGIAPEHHERIFVRFEQVSTGDTRRYGGTGLGLSIARSLVRLHGGELRVESELGRGATFVFHLPRLQRGVGENDAKARAS